MSSSQRKKGIYLVLGLMILLLIGLLWHGGGFFQGSGDSQGEAGSMGAKTPAGPVVVTQKISAPSSGQADAAVEKTLTGNRKKLPPLSSPTPKSEPSPVALPPVSTPAAVGQEKPLEPQALPPVPPVAVASPAPEVSQKTPEKPIEVKTPPPAIAAAPVAPKSPKVARVADKREKGGPGLYPFSLLLCSHRIEKNALAMQPDFERKGLTPHIVYTDLGDKGKWWRTLLGTYKNYKEALQAIKDLNLQDVVPVKTPFANLLGDFPSEKEAAGAASQFTSKGLFPYLAKGAGNAARLLVGAFPAQAAAEQQQRGLEGMGIIARVIQR